LSTLKKLASQTAVYGLSSILGRLLNYLLVPLYTNIFLPEQYGVVTELYAYVSFFAVVMTYGMETAFFRYSQKEGANQQKIYVTSLLSIIGSTLILLILGFVFTNEIAIWLKYEKFHWYLQCFMIVIAIDAVTAIPFAKLRAENSAFKFVVIRLINIFVNIALNLFFLVLCPIWKQSNPNLVSFIYDEQIEVGYIFIANLVASFITLILLIPQFKFKFEFDKEVWKELIKYALPLLLVGLAGMVNETADRVMLKYLLPAGSNVMAETGIYGACYKISIIMTIFIQTFRYAAEPFFFSHAKNKGAEQLYADVMKYFVIACAGIFLMTLLYMDIVKFFVGKKYWEGLHIVPVLLLANWFLGIYFNLTVWYKLTNKTGYGAGISIFGALLTIVFNLILIPKLGYYGAALTTLICYTGMMILSYYQGQKHFPINYDLKKIIGYIVFVLALYAISTFFLNFIPLLKLSLNTILILIFFGSVWILEKRDLMNLKNK
jgi:O-antigen/teichoic acid export membrane protein